MRAEGLRRAVAILIAGTAIGVVVGSANANAETVAELEASDTTDSGVRNANSAAQRADQRLEQLELRSQRWKERLTHARAVLLDGIELSAEQSREVDAIIEGELENGRRSGELRLELVTAQKQRDTERTRAIRKESHALRARRKGPDECMEEMRALLSEKQRPIFDMNRARLAAEGQQPQEGRRQKKSRAGAQVDSE